jgi:hypothetical protein
MTAAALADQAYDREQTPVTETMHEEAYAALHAELKRLHTHLRTGPLGDALVDLARSIAGFLQAQAEDEAERQRRAVSAALAQLSYLISSPVGESKKLRPDSGALRTLLLTLDQLFLALAESFPGCTKSLQTEAADYKLR